MLDLETRLATLEAAAPIKTVLGYELENTEASPVGTYELIRTVGNFTKHRAGTSLRLDWSAHSVTTGPANAFCHYQLRIDGRANDGDNAINYQGDQEGNVVSYVPVGNTNQTESVSTFAEFPGVAAGLHTVQIYVRGLNGVTACTLNDVNFNQQVVVEEYGASSLSTFEASAVAATSDQGAEEGGAEEGGG